MNLLHLLDDDKCFEVIRAHRWPEGVRCPHCNTDQITRQGRGKRQHARQRYRCLACRQKFDRDGVNEVHVNTMEGVWSLLRSWLRPHRGISQRFLSLYIGFFQAMHNIRQRGQRPSVLMRAVLDKKSLLSPLIALLLTPAP